MESSWFRSIISVNPYTSEASCVGPTLWTRKIKPTWIDPEKTVLALLLQNNKTEAQRGCASPQVTGLLRGGLKFQVHLALILLFEY